MRITIIVDSNEAVKMQTVPDTETTEALDAGGPSQELINHLAEQNMLQLTADTHLSTIDAGSPYPEVLQALERELNLSEDYTSSINANDGGGAPDFM